MPKGVVKTGKEEKIWEYKKRQIEKQTGKKSSQFSDSEWRRVNFLFQKAKKKYKGKLPKKYSSTSKASATASFKQLVLATYTIVEALKPLEHFKSSGLRPFWSIQTERTRGRKGIIRVSRSQLEDPNMAMTTRPDYKRMAGAEDIFQGDRVSLMAYIKNKYKDFKTIEFAKS
jgi:hypothetical protein